MHCSQLLIIDQKFQMKLDVGLYYISQVLHCNGNSQESKDLHSSPLHTRFGIFRSQSADPPLWPLLSHTPPNRSLILQLLFQFLIEISQHLEKMSGLPLNCSLSPLPLCRGKRYTGVRLPREFWRGADLYDKDDCDAEQHGRQFGPLFVKRVSKSKEPDNGFPTWKYLICSFFITTIFYTTNVIHN